MSIFEQGLEPTAVNHIALSPLSFIERTASVYPDYPAVIHGSIRRTWAQTYSRCRRLACALAGRGIGKNDTVAVMLPNIPAMLEVHFAVPMIGAVLNALNVRLDAEAIAFMLAHGEAKVLIADREFHDVVHAAVAMLDHPPLIIDVDDQRRMVEHGHGSVNHVMEFTVGNQYLGFAVSKHEGNGFGIKAHVEGIENSANHRDSKVHFQHRRDVGQHHRHGVVLAYPAASQCTRQAPATAVGLCPGAANGTVDHGRVVGVDAGGALDKAQRREGNMVDSSGLEALLKNRHDGHSGG